MKEPIVKAKRTYSRYVADQTIEDYSLRYTSSDARHKSAFTVANAALGSISFLALEVVGANIAIFYGLNHLLWSLLVAIPLIYFLSKPIANYAIKCNIDIDLLTRGASFGYLGSSLTSLVYASFTFIFLAFEATILANLLFYFLNIPLWIGYLLSSVVVIPLILKGFNFISKFQRLSQPLWTLLQLISIVGSVYLIKNDHLNLNLFNIKTDFNFIFFGYSISIILALVSQIGEQVDYLRFMPQKKKNQSIFIKLFINLSGAGWIILGGIKIFIGGLLGVYLMSKGASSKIATDPNYMYLSAFSAIFSTKQIVLILTILFVILSQVKINVTNGYAGSLAWSNFFSRLTHTHPGRFFWVFFNVIIAYILVNYGIYSISAKVLSFYSILAIAWISTIVADLAINKKLGLSPKRIEFKRAYLYDINPVGFGTMIIASTIGYCAFFDLFGEYATAFSAVITMVVALICCPCFAYLTKGKYYLARPVDKIEGKHECTVCNNIYDAEDLCYCPRYDSYICSLCCTLDSTCLDKCKPTANIHYQINSLLPKKFRGKLSSHLLKIFGHLIIYTILNITVLVITYFTLKENFNFTNSKIIINGLSLTFLLFEFFFIIFSVLFALVDESRTRAQNEFQFQNRVLEKEIVARQKTEKLLQEAKQNADAANLAKTRYLSGISHELRTPLNTITGYGQLLENDTELPLKYRHQVDIMISSGQYLADLIEGLLDISKIEAGKLELHYDTFNFKALLNELVEYFSTSAKRKGLTFNYHFDEKLPNFVNSEEKRLRQILINLLSNAVKYTKEGSVDFDIRYRNEVAIFKVKDTGIGMNKDDLRKIFEPFNRLENAKKQAKGTGLGLTITNLLVTILGGDLSVESKLNEGSTFTLKIKINSVINFDKNNIEVKDDRTIIGYKDSDTNPFKILEVDDNDDHRNLIKAMTEPLGFVVDTADCPRTALEKVKTNQYDIYLVDISMPEHDGWYLLQKLREQKINKPIIMVSAEVREGNVPNKIKQLHNGYIIKPFKLSKLLEKFNELLPIEFIYRNENAQKQSSLSNTDNSDITNLVQNNNKSLDKKSDLVTLDKISFPHLNLSDNFIERYKINLDIGYIKGIQKLHEELLKSNIIDSKQKEILDSLLSKMDFEELKNYLLI